jgi:hypothetical protein
LRNQAAVITTAFEIIPDDVFSFYAPERAAAKRIAFENASAGWAETRVTFGKLG